jgi:hypothetical protein
MVFFLAIVPCYPPSTSSNGSAVFRPALYRISFLFHKAPQTRHQIVEIDLMPVEVRAVDARETHLLADLHAATAAHTGTVDHDRVQTDHGLDTVRTRGLGARPHHDRRTDRNELIDIRMIADGELHAVGGQPLDARRSVIRTNDEFIAAAAELVFPENEILGAKAHDANDISAALFESTGLRINRRDTEPAADADDLFRVARMARQSHRPHHGVELRAASTRLLHLFGRLAHRLDNQRDGSFLAVEVSNGERDTLAVFSGHYDNELARAGGFGH